MNEGLLTMVGQIASTTESKLKTQNKYGFVALSKLSMVVQIALIYHHKVQSATIRSTMPICHCFDSCECSKYGFVKSWERKKWSRNKEREVKSIMNLNNYPGLSRNTNLQLNLYSNAQLDLILQQTSFPLIYKPPICD